MKELLQVVDTFQISGRGLVLAPDIPFPSKFKNFTDLVFIKPPHSEPFEVTANFFLTHFRPGGYKLMVTLPVLTMDLVPIGSLVLASEAVHNKLRVANA